MVVLTQPNDLRQAQIKTNVDGTFRFAGVSAGVYTVKAEKDGLGEASIAGLAVASGEKKHIELVLAAAQAAGGKNSSASPAKNSGMGTMEFEDKPNFTVAGVTDWSNVGLHGSGTEVRTSEALAKETAALGMKSPSEGAAESKAVEAQLREEVVRAPKSFAANHRLGEFYCEAKQYSEAIPPLAAAEQIEPGNLRNAYELALAFAGAGDLTEARARTQAMIAKSNTAEAHRLAGEIYEWVDDPLQAVREFEKAARMEGSEENYFEWGSELLLHRAAKPAVEVFGKGSGLHPDSARMLTGLGAALFADGAFEEATKQLCKAADLKPQDASPYVFLGKIEEATVDELSCSEEKLARFAKEQPENALANYYLGIALRKRTKNSEDETGEKRAEEFFEKAVRLDPKLSEGYLQLGIIRAKRGETGKAAEDYQKAIEINPRSGPAHFRLAMVYKSLRKEAQAQAELQKFQQIEKEEAEVREQERRKLRQFQVILENKTENGAPR